MHELTEHSWAKANTNLPLVDDTQVKVAKMFAAVHKLPLHDDRWKNWDNMLAVHQCLRTTDKDEHVLDAGACRDPKSPSVFLPSLKSLGYEYLHGCNLDEPEGDGVMEDGVFYTHQNIERTNYPQDYFSFIACLSVIEHGVDWRKYFAEMSRVLKSDGHLFTSFDYWPTPIDTGDRQAFGVPVKIFDKTDVMNMVVFASGMGLTVVKEPVLEVPAQKPVVNWLGLDYTFFNLLLRKN